MSISKSTLFTLPPAKNRKGSNEISCRWGDLVSALADYVAFHGHCEPAYDWLTPERSFPLGRWVPKLRAAYKRGALSGEQIQVLSKAGMEWSTVRGDRAHMVSHLADYIATTGMSNVHKNHVEADGCKLGRNVVQWRVAARQGKMSANFLALLVNMGFDFGNGFADRFMFIITTELDLYIEEHGSAKVPRAYTSPSGFRLGSWLSDRRREHADGRLTPAQQKLLKSRGVDLELRHTKGNTRASSTVGFQVYLEAYKQYRAAHKTDAVAPDYKTASGLSLGKWATSIAKANKNHALTTRQRQQLKAAQFPLT